VSTAVWIAARLAEALQHAHDRGVLHRDVKPSNVLLAADGQPMLLDFNIALEATTAAQGRDRAVLSGTVAYMSPEHLRALASRDPSLARAVDHRSDLYSLGLVLFEMLAGHKPFEQTGSYSPAMPLVVAMALERGRAAPSIRAVRRDVPWSLESILRKCLAADPVQRYQRADHLAEDCRRFLQNLPLRYAPELSRVERARKWMRRHPRLTSAAGVSSVAAVLLLTAGAALFGARAHLAQAKEELVSVESRERKRAFEKGATRAVCLVNTFTELRDHLREGREVCEQTLGLYDILDRDDWQQGAHWQKLEPEEQQALAEDARELLLLLAWARVRTDNGSDGSLRQALGLLDRAEAIEGLPPSRALAEDRALYLEKLGNASEAAAARDTGRKLQPAGARDHYLLATACARAGRYEDAVAELDRALHLNPRHYWSVLQRGICYQELGRHALATADFGACTGLWPEFAWGYFNRAYALSRGGDKQEALREYGLALERDPAFVPALVNRGMLRLELKQFHEALADFDRAAELGRDDTFLHVSRGMALEGLKRPKEADVAFAKGLARIDEASAESRTRLRLAYGFAVAPRRPDDAHEAFKAILDERPDHPQALYGQAMVLVEKGQEASALGLFNRAITAAPDFVEARRARAILLARRGDLAPATQDVNWCLEREPSAGPTLYAAACVAARAAEKFPDARSVKQAINQSLSLLQKAFARGYGWDRAAADPDLAFLRDHQGFRRLLETRPASATTKKP
jgi:tetratricopeptide (TPR) repeat protein